MATQRAVIVRERGQVALVDDLPIPSLPDDYILVKTRAVALNPTDWKHVDFESCNGAVVGCDYAGIVEAIGSQVRKSWKKGERIAGFVHGCDIMRPHGGAFAEYVIAKGDLQFNVPDWMSLEEAACLGVGMTTIGQNLYQSMQLAEPGKAKDEEDEDEGVTQILIYGGATATGSLAIQFAKLSGLRVVTTCSEVNRAWMLELGADAVFDYHDSQVGDRIREETDDALELVFDTISTNASAAICAAAISSSGGCYNALLDVRCPRADVDTQVSMAYDMIGEPYQMGGKEVPATPANLQFGSQWADTVEKLLQTRQITPHRLEAKSGGLAGIPAGLDLLRQGKVRASKLVYCVDETQ
ncbi:zinc-binding alcohol dehydrogenase family protein [Aspergillus aculeatinus CBS 121060]|uniref:Oxidoreductase n=1 Tax=Aspergillus aculeatinus CBS 121060 TaxID=1448322 RepID=A0ACD1GWR4_9EURO|nr:oxidoreductase [Aspergillus aculeatinus CBS 121060]RAH65910.1 oxidoreductase [Aspergillus aculeatinus CBS 121060]